MKTKLILALLLTFVFGTIQTIEAQNRGQQKVQINKQKKFSRSNLTFKFVSLIEDSRCPEGTNCVWAGNAKIKIEVSQGKSKKTFELNTNLEPKGAVFNAYAIKIISLTPSPKENVKLNRNAYIATFEISRPKG